MNTLLALTSSRKFWLGTITVAAIVGAVVMRVTGKIESSDLGPTIAGISSVAMMVIGSIAWEDTAAKRVEAAKATPTPPAVENAVAVNVAPANDGSKGDVPKA